MTRPGLPALAPNPRREAPGATPSRRQRRRHRLLTHPGLTTPAFVCDAEELASHARSARRTAEAAGCSLLYSVKACFERSLLEALAPWVAGFACSSPYEAVLARGVLPRGAGSLHFTAPGIDDDAAGELARLCDYVSFNSLSQWRRFAPRIAPGAACGLRINPELSFVPEPSYDPCRRDSKLGVPMSRLPEVSRLREMAGGTLSGLHFHSNGQSDDYRQLLATVDRIEEHLGPLLADLRWINLGGGYATAEGEQLELLSAAVAKVRSHAHLEVFLEPGTALVAGAVDLVATVVDLTRTPDGERIAVLDTSAFHLPETVEFGLTPRAFPTVPGGAHRYLLAGASCHPGDLFGRHTFAEPLEEGDRVAFLGVGAYSLVKAQWFNGLRMPGFTWHHGDGELVPSHRPELADFLRFAGVP